MDTHQEKANPTTEKESNQGNTREKGNRLEDTIRETRTKAKETANQRKEK